MKVCLEKGKGKGNGKEKHLKNLGLLSPDTFRNRLCTIWILTCYKLLKYYFLNYNQLKLQSYYLNFIHI